MSPLYICVEQTHRDVLTERVCERCMALWGSSEVRDLDPESITARLHAVGLRRGRIADFGQRSEYVDADGAIRFVGTLSTVNDWLTAGCPDASKLVAEHQAERAARGGR